MSVELLDRLLAEIEACPVGELTSRFSIGDNYTILLRGDFTKIADGLEISGRWRYSQKLTDDIPLGDIGDYSLFEYVDGDVILQALSWPMTVYEEITKAGSYNCSFLLNWDPRTDDYMTNSPIRTFAGAVRDLINYVKDKKIPAYFVNTKLDGQPVLFEPAV